MTITLNANTKATIDGNEVTIMTKSSLTDKVDAVTISKDALQLLIQELNK